MSELDKGFYEGLDGEIDLEYFYMLEIEVDGIKSSYQNPNTNRRGVVLQPMFELKADEDWTAPMHWSDKGEIDEEAWIKEGYIKYKH